MSYVPKYTPGTRDVLLLANHSLTGIYAYDLTDQFFIASDNTLRDGIYRSANQSVGAVFASPYGDFFSFLVFGSAETFDVRADTWDAASVLPALTSPTNGATSDGAVRPSGQTAFDTYAYPGAGTRVAIANGRTSVVLDDFGTGTRQTLSPPGNITNVAWSEDTSVIAITTTTAPYVYAYRFPDLTGINLPTASPPLSGSPCAVAVSPDGRYVAAARYDSVTSTTNLVIYDLTLGSAGIRTGITYAQSVFFSDATALTVGRTASNYTWDYTVGPGGATSYLGANTVFHDVADRVGRIKNSSCGRFVLVVETNRVLVYHRATMTLYREVSLTGLYDADIGTFGHTISNANGLPVRAADGAPIPGVKVSAYRRDTMELCRTAVTDAEGKYIIPVGGVRESFVVFQGKNENEGSVIVDRVVPV